MHNVGSEPTPGRHAGPTVTDGTRQPVTSQAEESATFLYALARRIATRVLVFVPLRRRARILWFATPGTDEELQPLRDIGRALLDANDGFRAEWTPDRSTRFTGDPRIAVLVTRALDGEVVGALVAQKEPGHEWSRSEHALLEFATDFYRRPLTYAARRPLPTPRLDLDRRRSRAEAAELESGMRTAADRGELFLLYQPEVDLVTGDIVAVEALTRWLHPTRGELGPDSFIALAEQSDLIQVLGAWVIEESFRDFATWQATLAGLAIVLRINVSPTQLLHPGFVNTVRAALDRHGIPGDRVCVELTENIEITAVDAVRQALADLRALGITSAIDDLASGYSTLGRLRALPVDLVKLDRSLVSGVADDPRAQAIVGGIVGIAAGLGADVIAEGVETVEDADALVRLGCGSAQGHYFARPMSAADTAGFLVDFGRAEPSGTPPRS